MFINLVLIEDIKLVHAAIILTQSRIRRVVSSDLREVETALELEFVRLRAETVVELCKFILMALAATRQRKRKSGHLRWISDISSQEIKFSFIKKRLNC